MATLEKTFAFTADRVAVDARDAASKALTPQERCAAMLARLSAASSRDFIQGRVF